MVRPKFIYSLLIQFVPRIHHSCTEESAPLGPSLFLNNLYPCLLVLLSTLILKNLCADIASFPIIISKASIRCHHAASSSEPVLS